MTRLTGLVFVLATSLAAAGCLVSGRHGHVAFIAPPAPFIVAAAVAATADQVWVEGHWDWIDGRWVWSAGFWMPARPGYVWEQGVWLHAGSRYHWRPGAWRPDPRFHARGRRR